MGLQVIGAGLGRTGTASLKVALEQLGLGKCYHMGELLRNLNHTDLWIEAANGDFDWNRLFSGYEAAVDYPACNFWEELVEFYPEARMILTTRDANDWFDSVYTTIMSPGALDWAFKNPIGRDLYTKIVLRDFGDQVHDRAFMVDYFEKRNTQIIDTFPSDRLLVYEVKQGWEPLCNFLGLPVPDKPYPHVNTRVETQAMFQGYLERDPTAAPDQEFSKSQAEKLFNKNSSI